MRFAHSRFTTAPGQAAAALAAAGAAAVILAAALAGGVPALAASTTQASTTQASTTQASTTQASTTHASTALASTAPVLVTCGGQRQTRPSSYVISCADGNWGIEHISWATWSSTAYAPTATVYMNDCDPYCASPHAKFYYFPALITLWRAQPLPGHHGATYFSRLSWIYTGSHCMPQAGGKTYCPPATGTFDLGPYPEHQAVLG